MPRPPLDGAVALTGASSGLGRELARQMAARASQVRLIARRAHRLEELAEELRSLRPGLEVEVHTVDLADDAQRARLADDLRTRPVDVLVNCAGFGDLTFFDQSDAAKIRNMLAVNVAAVSELTHAVLPSMVKKGTGGILNISSIAGMTCVPSMAAYGATKHFVAAFSETLRMELSGTGVVVTCVCPGPVGTEFETVADNRTGVRAPAWVHLGADACASQSLRAFAKGRSRVVPGWLFTPVGWVVNIAPRWLSRLVFAPSVRWRRRVLSMEPPTEA